MLVRPLVLILIALATANPAHAKKLMSHRRPAQAEPIVCPPSLPRTGLLKMKNNVPFQVSVVTPCEVQKYFAEVAAAPDIPYQYPEDGCYARAHAMSRILEREDVITGKVFVEGNLRVETKNSPKGYVEWWYHVAPVLLVDRDGTPEVDVLDPSIFDHAVPVNDWLEIQTRHTNARRDNVYQTPRFNYIPNEKDEDLNDYKPEDIKDMDDTLLNYSKVVTQRKAGTSEPSGAWATPPPPNMPPVTWPDPVLPKENRR